MNGAPTREEILAERERKLRKEELDRFNDEQLPDERRAHRKFRVYRNGKKDDAGLLGLKESSITTAFLFNHFADNVKKAVEALIHLVHHWPTVTEHIKQSPYIHVADTMDHDLTVAFAPVAVSPKVADILKQQIELVREAQADIDREFETSAFLGPHPIQEKIAYEQKRAFHVRHNPDADCYAHCVTQVARLEEELGETDAPKTEMAYIFGVIAAPAASRGYDNKVAEAGAEISASNLANIEAAQQARPVPPPRFNIV